MAKPQPKLLVEQQQALWDYLDALLQEIPEDLDEDEPAPVVVVSEAEPQPEEIQSWDPEALAPAADVEEVAPEPPSVELAPGPEVVVEPEPEVAVEVEVVPRPVAAQPLAAEPPATEPEGPPEWTRPDFQALLFKVDGLTLAVPLVKLHSVIPWSDSITPLPNQPDWCRGIVRYREQNVKVVDTGRLVIPEDKRAQLEPQPPKHVLIVGDGKWGLACTALGEVVKLEPDEVKWRSGSGRRPWLAGTVLGHLCALLDTEAFAGMLKDAKSPKRGRN